MKLATKVVLAIGVLALIALGWYLLSPLFIAKERYEVSPLDSAQTQREEIIANNATEALVPDASTINPSASVVSSGSFVDSAHEVPGNALIIDSQGEQTLRLENFDTLNGPDLRLYLATDADASDFIDLGELKGTKGSANYAVPKETDVQKYNHVLVWCRAFSVNFGHAVLE